jgi:polysaccharide biosynthesis protein PslH
MTDRSILFVAADTPWPPDGGGRIATLRVLEAMAELGTIDLVALSDGDRDADLSHLRSLCRQVELVPHPFTFGRHRLRQATVALSSLAGRTPYRLRKFVSRRLASTLSRMKRERTYDLVHHDQLGVAPYRDPAYPSTLTTQNVETEIYRLGARHGQGARRRSFARIEAQKLATAERALYRAFDAVFTLSEDDAEFVRRSGAPSVAVLPIPVDVRAAPIERPRRPKVVSLGSMSWFGVEEGLLWFHANVLPVARAAVPDLTWHLIGPNASDRMRAIADGERVVMRGYVADLEDELSDAAVCVIPLHVAGGVRIKLLEMMARGLPCVTTTRGGAGLAFEDGEGALRRDDPAAFAAAIVDLVRDPTLWTSVAERGRRYVAAHHTRERLREALGGGIEAAVAGYAQRHASRET